MKLNSELIRQQYVDRLRIALREGDTADSLDFSDADFALHKVTVAQTFAIGQLLNLCEQQQVEIDTLKAALKETV